jgi:hypothetical protein
VETKETKEAEEEKMKPNTTPNEFAAACGTARRAVEITGGDEATALFYLNNAELIPTATPAKTYCLSGFGASLRALRDQQDEAERKVKREALAAEQRRLAAQAWELKHTLAAVMRFCGVGRDTARRLVAELRSESVNGQ